MITVKKTKRQMISLHWHRFEEEKTLSSVPTTPPVKPPISSTTTNTSKIFQAPLKEFFDKWKELVKMRLGPKIVEKKNVVSGRAWQEQGQKYQHLKIMNDLERDTFDTIPLSRKVKVCT